MLRLIAKGASCLAVSLSRGEMPLQLSLGFAQGCAGDSLPGSSVRDCRGATSLPFAKRHGACNACLHMGVLVGGRLDVRGKGVFTRMHEGVSEDDDEDSFKWRPPRAWPRGALHGDVHAPVGCCAVEHACLLPSRGARGSGDPAAHLFGALFWFYCFRTFFFRSSFIITPLAPLPPFFHTVCTCTDNNARPRTLERLSSIGTLSLFGKVRIRTRRGFVIPLPTPLMCEAERDRRGRVRV